jgi:hypothetical protein
MSAAVAIRTDAANFIEQGVSPLCSEGAPPDADPNFIYTAARVERVALVDHDFDETIAGGVYFWPTRRIVRKGTSGRLLKKPREYVVPGAAMGTIGWLDFHPWGDHQLYIDYVTTRHDVRHLGVARRLVRLFYERIAIPRGIQSVNWGDVRHEHAWSLMRQMRTEMPAIESFGKHRF